MLNHLAVKLYFMVVYNILFVIVFGFNDCNFCCDDSYLAVGVCLGEYI